MAKKSAIARDLKRAKLNAKFAKKRAELLESGDRDGLQKLPHNASPTRLKNRDNETGRHTLICANLVSRVLVFVNTPARVKSRA